MPQREFWTEAHPVEVRWTYRTDLTHPEAPGHLTISVFDQAGKLMEHAAAAVPFESLHEAIGQALVESWEGFLFGERHDGPRALKLAIQRAKRSRRAETIRERFGL